MLGIVALVVILIVLVGLTVRTFFTRAVVEDGTVKLHALRRRENLKVPLERVVGYHSDKSGDWWIHTRPDGTTCTDPAERTRVAVPEPWELHRAFLDLAPKKLGARKMRFPGVPPPEDFRGLWTYDVEHFASRAVSTIVGVILLLAIFRRGNGALIGQLVGLLLPPLMEAWGRLDVTRDGLVKRGPLYRHEIRWSEARAIFREGGSTKRSFVIVGPDGVIHVPAHLASDRDLIEKLLYSLPDPILTVNFDETTLRGYKRRKKAKESAPQEDLLPALTA